MERVTLVRENSEVNRILSIRVTSPDSEASTPIHHQMVHPSRERIFVLREGPMDKKETLDESGD